MCRPEYQLEMDDAYRQGFSDGYDLGHELGYQDCLDQNQYDWDSVNEELAAAYARIKELESNPVIKNAVVVQQNAEDIAKSIQYELKQQRRNL